ncbi:MAG TPA: hypothetical protein PKW33_15425 [Anaerolineaceae bacterium]|nr:hypothetical protein [Anaerolineaceae bacterium]HPN52985.1 hypothetical protein [Anaerolineaceae bacterium]
MKRHMTKQQRRRCSLYLINQTAKQQAVYFGFHEGYESARRIYEPSAEIVSLVARLENERNAARSELDVFKTANEDLRAKVEELRAENKRLQGEIDVLDLDVSETGIVINEFENQRDQALKQRDAAREEVVHLNVELVQAHAELEAERAKRCEWKQVDPYEETTWSTSCGEIWEFSEGGPNENRVLFCHRCGGKVEAICVPAEYDEDEE